MSVVTVTLTDRADGGVDLQGSIDNPNAVNEQPTPALIIGSYLAANAARVINDSVAWFKQEIVAPERDDDVIRLIVPGDRP